MPTSLSFFLSSHFRLVTTFEIYFVVVAGFFFSLDKIRVRLLLHALAASSQRRFAPCTITFISSVLVVYYRTIKLLGILCSISIHNPIIYVCVLNGFFLFCLASPPKIHFLSLNLHVNTIYCSIRNRSETHA